MSDEECTRNFTLPTVPCFFFFRPLCWKGGSPIPWNQNVCRCFYFCLCECLLYKARIHKFVRTHEKTESIYFDVRFTVKGYHDPKMRNISSIEERVNVHWFYEFKGAGFAAHRLYFINIWFLKISKTQKCIWVSALPFAHTLEQGTDLCSRANRSSSNSKPRPKNMTMCWDIHSLGLNVCLWYSRVCAIYLPMARRLWCSTCFH